MGSQGKPSSTRSGASSARRPMAWLSASTPRPVTVDTRQAGSGRRPLARTRSSTAAALAAACSSATRSALAIAGSTRSRPSRPAISRCSTVWGFTPSLAATTSSTASIPVAPEIRVRTKRSWPGMSMKSTSAWPKRAWAKPSAMETPRRRSSGRRSVSMPVRARTRAVLPWSTWPITPSDRRRTSLTAPAPRPPGRLAPPPQRRPRSACRTPGAPRRCAPRPEGGRRGAARRAAPPRRAAV